MVIFLSNFLALLIKADAAGEDNREILGGILVAVNVLLFVAVVFATWFATHQAVVDTRDGAEALGVARAVLTFEKRAAASARFTRQQTTSSALLLASSASSVAAAAAAADVRPPGSGGGEGLREEGGVGRADDVGPAAAFGTTSATTADDEERDEGFSESKKVEEA